MFDFFYVNKIETNLAVQSNSLHVKQKIAPLRRKEPKLVTPCLPPLPSALAENTAFLPMNVLFRAPEREYCRQELTPTPSPHPKCFLIKIKDIGSMLKVAIIANYLHKKGKTFIQKSPSPISFCGALTSPKLLLCGFRSGLRRDIKKIIIIKFFFVEYSNGSWQFGCEFLKQRSQKFSSPLGTKEVNPKSLFCPYSRKTLSDVSEASANLDHMTALHKPGYLWTGTFQRKTRIRLNFYPKLNANTNEDSQVAKDPISSRNGTVSMSIHIYTHRS